MRFTKIRPDTFKKIQLNAGILIADTAEHYLVANESETTTSKHVFDTLEDLADATWDDLLGATTGGIEFTAEPSFYDYGEDIDNCPQNMKELKRVESWEVTMSGSFVAIDPSTAQRMIGSADISHYEEEESNEKLQNEKVAKVVPRDLLQSDYINIWWIGDYSDNNTEENGGYIAIHMYNALSTGGFHLQTGNFEKGEFEFEFTAHYEMENQTRVPFTVYFGSDDLEVETGTSTTLSLKRIFSNSTVEESDEEADPVLISKDED